MKLPKITESEIKKARNNQEILQLTAEQVIKDFAMFGVDVSFSGNTEMLYPELFEQLCKQLEVLINEKYEKLRSLLYQIDISEAIIKKSFTNKSPDEFPAILSDLILNRELKKVLIRIYFRDLDQSTSSTQGYET